LLTQEAKNKLIKHFLSQNDPIKITLPNQGTCYVLYEESSVLMQLRYYPIIQFIIIIIFAVAGYLILSFARRSEQNRVWVGMSKETAHQLGTPISSLLAWNELLKDQDVDQSIMIEIEKDVNRLETIAQRFSKIGSEPELVMENIATIIEEFVEYLQSRISSKVVIKVNHNEVTDFNLKVNRYLFEWVIENLCKNSVDAMNGNGVIIIDLSEDEKFFYVDVSDTGKGIPFKEFNLLFQPGYTTKKRGWGLGLPLAKRIIKQYHKGRLFVKSSSMGRGTVMRIQLRK
jgi:signal transduction histidine kinase